MKNIWVHLKDNVAFAYVESDNFVENAILLEENLTWEDVKAKKYSSGEWINPELIYFVELIKDGVIQKINSTVFISDASPYIVDENVKIGWVLQEDGSFIDPNEVI